MGNTAKQCRLGLFQDSDFAGDLEDSTSTSGGTLCVFGSHTFVPISWMCKKQTAVSHSSTESETISLDTGVRLDGLLALELWDLIVSFLGNISRVSSRAGQPVNGKNKSHNKIDVVKDIDLVPSNVQSASREALLYVLEDNEAVIKMIKKGRSPTMRHVSRTHRVALDWLLDRINLNPKIQIKCEGCLVVITGHGPQAEVAQVFGHELLVELGGRHLEGLEEEQRKGEEKETGEENNHHTTHK